MVPAVLQRLHQQQQQHWLEVRACMNAGSHLVSPKWRSQHLLWHSEQEIQVLRQWRQQQQQQQQGIPAACSSGSCGVCHVCADRQLGRLLRLLQQLEVVVSERV
jgi:hypothetical protein